MLITQMERDTNDRLPAYALPGCYPVIYLTQYGTVQCPDCATEELDGLCNGDESYPRHEQDEVLTYADVHYEGMEVCENCGTILLGAYEDGWTTRADQDDPNQEGWDDNA